MFHDPSFMSIFDFLKRKKETEKSRKSPQKDGKNFSNASDKNKKEVLNEKKSFADNKSVAEKSVLKTKKENSGKFSYETVKEPHISEKAGHLGEENKYIFKIYNNTNKSEIKKSVEGIYGVNVVSVNTIKIPAKKRRLGRTEGFKKGYNKAIVTIREGQKIEVL